MLLGRLMVASTGADPSPWENGSLQGVFKARFAPSDPHALVD